MSVGVTSITDGSCGLLVAKSEIDLVGVGLMYGSSVGQHPGLLRECCRRKALEGYENPLCFVSWNKKFCFAVFLRNQIILQIRQYCIAAY